MAVAVRYIALITFFLIIFTGRVLYFAFFFPLGKIPCPHWSCRFSSAWIYWKRWSNTENGAVYDAHMNLGSVLRLAPNLLSVNCFENGLKTIYQGGFPKTAWYIHGFSTYGQDNIFTLLDNQSHSARRKIISNTFSKTFLFASRPAQLAIRDVLFGSYLPRIRGAAKSGTPIETLEMNFSVSMDLFTQWQYGRTNASNFLDDEKERKMYLTGFFATHNYVFWQYYFPKLTQALNKINIFLIPKWVLTGFDAIEQWNLEKCDKAQQQLASEPIIATEDQPVVFEGAMKAMSNINSKSSQYPRRLEVASDMFAHNSAAFETSGVTETYIFYAMSKHPEWQKKLRHELLALETPPIFDPTKDYQPEDLASAKELDKLPVLEAIILETMRLWPPVPGGQPRVSPRVCTIGNFEGIPAGVVMQSYAWVLHNTPEVFPDPRVWKPERWLEASPEQLSTMRKWFWAFGSGTRMCVGSHFSYFSMKWVAASVYANFTTTVFSAGDMDLIDAYLSGPKGHRLEIMFHEVTE